MKRILTTLFKAGMAGSVVALTMFFAGTVEADPPDPTTEARVLLEFCRAHPEACSISIDYTKGGTAWHLDYQGTRLNSLASTYKVIILMAYAEAVEAGRITPTDRVTVADWTRFWVGQDGNALRDAKIRFGVNGPTDTVTIKQIVSAMVQESDNAAADYLLDKLGYNAVDGIVERFITGGHRATFVDKPQSINATFAVWGGNPADPLSGRSALENYSGYESKQFREKVQDIFERMRDPHYTAAIGAPAQNTELTDAEFQKLEKNYFMRSNTRTFNEFMRGLLRGGLLPPNVQPIFQANFEWDPNAISNGFLRYGIKSGGFSTWSGTTVRTRTFYAEHNDGTQVVFTVHLTGTPGTDTDLGPDRGSLDLAIHKFGLALATNPTFAEEVRSHLPNDPLAPSLIARVVTDDSTPHRAKIRVNIKNIGTARAPASDIRLFLTDNTNTHGTRADAEEKFEALAPGESNDVGLAALIPTGKTHFVLVIDAANRMPAGEKQNNPQFGTVPQR